MIRRKSPLLLLPVLLATVAGCMPDNGQDIVPDDGVDHVVIYYGCGFNNLTDELSDNVRTILESPLPRKYSGDHILIFEHLADIVEGMPSYSDPKPGILLDAWQDRDGKAHTDTIRVWETVSPLTKEGMSTVLGWITDSYQADVYSLILSSHGTGWMPVNEYNYSEVIWFGGPTAQECAVELPKTRSFGQECSVNPETGKIDGAEMDIKDLADALPIHFDNIIFDACLMGGIEVAYQLRGKADKIAFSQCEILAEGFYYESLLQRLVKDNDPEGLCEDFYNYYNAKSGSFRTGVISCIDCSVLEDLAGECRSLIGQCRDSLARLNQHDVQKYYSGSHKWFFDFEDIFIKCFPDDAKLSGLRKVLDAAVLYKGATPRILDLYDVGHHSGLSMYLPSEGRDVLDEYYRTLEWNEAVHLVE